MCRISYEKCVCFVFLVILAVLSCSGFRIDNIAMTDISKKNSHTSDSLLRSDELSERLFSAPSTSHRTRHHRQLRARGLAPTPHPNEHLAQIPSTEPHQSPTRSTRSSQKRQKKQCPEPDVSWKAYKADAIVRAKAESKSSNCRQNCTVQFRVLDWLKNRTSTDDRLLRLNFRSDKTNCEYDNLTNRSQFPVRAKIDQSKEYILFLNTYGPHNYAAVFVPELPKNKTIKIIKRVISPHFSPKRMMMDRCNRTLKRLRCKVRGFPFPIIYWKRNNVLLQPTQDYRITQKNEGKDRRRSTLAIRRHPEADSEWYECVARDVDGNEISHVFPPIKKPKERNHTGTSTTSTESPNLGRGKIDTAAHPSESPKGIPCKPEMDRVYCRNGGTCFYEEVIKEYSCECANGYRGRRCEEKSSDQSSVRDENKS
ncbi:uncharacterized protein [Tenebrio molitor]|uniref:uncharacterized protein isoform X5 n=1 Tax=Tenebrio molitor TaxID=7067 RepID=UPI003624A825